MGWQRLFGMQDLQLQNNKPYFHSQLRWKVTAKIMIWFSNLQCDIKRAETFGPYII